MEESASATTIWKDNIIVLQTSHPRASYPFLYKKLKWAVDTQTASDITKDLPRVHTHLTTVPSLLHSSKCNLSNIMLLYSECRKCSEEEIHIDRPKNNASAMGFLSILVNHTRQKGISTKMIKNIHT